MKRIRLMLLASAGLLFIVGCSPAPDDVTEEQAIPLVEAPVVTVAAELAPPEVSEPLVAPAGGFTTTPALDVSAMPDAIIVPTGGPPIFCGGQVDVQSVALELARLCFPGLGVTVDSPDFTVTMSSPDGMTFTETYTYEVVNGDVRIIGASGGRGLVFEALLDAPVPTVGIFLHTSANVPSGQWTVSVETVGGAAIAPTTVTLEVDSQMFSIEPQPVSNPLIEPGRKFSSGDTLYVFGANYAPDTTYLVVFYFLDASLDDTPEGRSQARAAYATNVTTDATGFLETQFVVGPETPAGEYLTFVDTQFPETVQVSFFLAHFDIQ